MKKILIKNLELMWIHGYKKGRITFIYARARDMKKFYYQEHDCDYYIAEIQKSNKFD